MTTDCVKPWLVPGLACKLGGETVRKAGKVQLELAVPHIVHVAPERISHDRKCYPIPRNGGEGKESNF
jgi:hypothetical protein